MAWQGGACILANGIMLLAALFMPGEVMATTTAASAAASSEGTGMSVQTISTTAGEVSVETIGTTTLTQTGGVSVETIGTTQSQTGGVSVETIGTTPIANATMTQSQTGGVSVETMPTTVAPATLTTTALRTNATNSSSAAWTTTRQAGSSSSWTWTTSTWTNRTAANSSAAWTTTRHAGSFPWWTWTHNGSTTWTTTYHHHWPCHGERLPEAHVTAAYTLSMEVKAPFGLAEEAVFCRLQAKIHNLKALLRSRGLSQEWDVAGVHFTNLLANHSLRRFMHRMVVNHSWSPAHNTSTRNASASLQRLRINGTSMNFVPFPNGTCKDGVLAIDDGEMIAQVITVVNATILLLGRGEGGEIESPNLSARVIQNATITNGVIANATLINSHINGSVCINVTFLNSNVTNGTIVDSTVMDSRVMLSSVVGSTVLHSNMNKSNVSNSSVFNSFMSNSSLNGSTMRASRAEGCEVNRSDVFESTLSQCRTQQSNVSCWSCGGAMDWNLDYGFDSDHTVPPPMMHHTAGAMGHMPEPHEPEREGEEDVSDEVRRLFGASVPWADLHWTVQEYEECDVGLPTEPWFWTSPQPPWMPPPCPEMPPPYVHYTQWGVLTLVFEPKFYHPYSYNYYNGDYYGDYYDGHYYSGHYYDSDGYYVHILPVESHAAHGETSSHGEGAGSDYMTTTATPHGRFLAPAEARRRLQDHADGGDDGTEERHDHHDDDHDEDRERREDRDRGDGRGENATGGHSPEPAYLTPRYPRRYQSEEARLLSGGLEVYFGHSADVNVYHVYYSRNWGALEATQDHAMPGHSATSWIYPATATVEVYFNGNQLNSPVMTNAALVKNLQLLFDVSSSTALSNLHLTSAHVVVDGKMVQDMHDKDDDDDEEGAWVWVFRAALIIVPNCMLCAFCQLGFIWFICFRRNTRTHPPTPTLAKEPIVGNIVEESNNNPTAVKAATIGKDAEKNAETMSVASTRSGSSLEKNPVVLAEGASAEELA